MRSLVVGLGIGQLYVKVFTELGYTVDTVDLDPNKNATYLTPQHIYNKGKYDIAVICTPNFTHEDIARFLAAKCKIILIEKPGVKDSNTWQQLIADYPKTRFMMVKNNQYREEIANFKTLLTNTKSVNLLWENKNRIPNPGSWFTTKSLAFGGVSRDLVPHMLSYFTLLGDYRNSTKMSWSVSRKHRLQDLTDTDYGTVNHSGIFDVDDGCELNYSDEDGQHWKIAADWKSNIKDEVSITFDNSIKFPLGLCPESAYKTMVTTAMENLKNDKFWKDQFEQDLWIHEQIETL